MIEAMVTLVLAIFFALGAYFGFQMAEPTEQQTEIINRACEYIYENEPLEVYTQYCK